MASTPVVTLPGLASFDRRASPRSRQSSRANSRERRHFRPYPESNTRTVPVDQSRKRRAPDQDPDGDVGMHSDREQDGDDESSGSSPPPVKQEQVSDVEQSPSPPPTPGSRPVRYALPPPQTQFAPTPPASARRVSPPHISLPTLHNSHVTLPPLHLAPPEPYQEPLGARKRRRVTISGVAGSQGVPQRPLHRTVLERAGGYQPPSATPATPTAGGMVSPVVTPGFNLNSPGAISQVRDTIAIRMEQKALIEQRKNGGVAVPIRRPTPPPPEPQPQAPPALAEPPAPTQTLANRRGRASKLTIHTPNTSVSSIAADPTPRISLAEAIRSAPPGVTRFDPASIRPPQPQPQPLRQPPKERSVSIRRMHANSTAAPPAPLAIVAPGQPLTLNAPAPPSSYIATPTRTQFPARTPRTAHPHPFRPPGPGSPPVSRDMFMAFYDAYAEAHTLRTRLESVEKEVDRRVEMAVREMRDEIRMLREEIRRGHEHSHREQAHRERADTHRGADPHRERADTHRGAEPHRERAETHREREWEHPSRMGLRSGSLSVSQSPMQLDKRPLPPITEKSGEALFVGRLPGPGDRLPPPPGERVPGPGERVPGPGERPERHVPSHLSGERHPERLSAGERLSAPSDRLSGPSDRLSGPSDRLPGPSDRLSGPSDRLSGPSDRLPGPGDRLPGPGDRLPGQGDRLAGPTGPERLQPHPPRSALRKSPSGRSPPSRPPSVGVEGRVRGKARVRTRSPAGSKSGSA